jgi:polyphosphate kinase 2 (PPK2 family)
MRAFEDVISSTSTREAPWYIVPANRKWFRNLVVADRVLNAVEAMKLKQPPPPAGVDFSKLRIV